MFHLAGAGLLRDYRIVGTSLDDLDNERFRELARRALTEFARRGITPSEWDTFAANLSFVSQADGAEGLAKAVAAAEAELPGEPQRLHYLSVPPQAALPVVHQLADADLVVRSRIVMEKPFGTTSAARSS